MDDGAKNPPGDRSSCLSSFMTFMQPDPGRFLSQGANTFLQQQFSTETFIKRNQVEIWNTLGQGYKYPSFLGSNDYCCIEEMFACKEAFYVIIPTSSTRLIHSPGMGY